MVGGVVAVVAGLGGFGWEEVPFVIRPAEEEGVGDWCIIHCHAVAL